MDGVQQCTSTLQNAPHSLSRSALTSFVPAVCRIASLITATSEDDEITEPFDPEKLDYLLRLIQALYDARFIAACYNIVILFVILALSLLHWREKRNDWRIWQARSSAANPEAGQASSLRNGSEGNSSSSSSSSTIGVGGTASPLEPTKIDSSDVERLPLLAGRNSRVSPLNHQRRKKSSTRRAISSWLARQPPPIPVVNKTLPSNGTSLFIANWIALNIFFHLLLLTFRWDFFFVFADKAGFIFIVNLPLLYLLGAKNQPLRFLTGYSYEALNIFHRRVGEFMCFEAVIHLVSMVVWQFMLMDDWLRGTTTTWEYFTHPLILNGIGAFASYELLYLTSLGSFRQRWYELFLASHVFLQAAALVFLWFHFYTSRPYVTVSLVIFLVDRIVWRVTLKRAAITADISILDDGNTYLLSADWEIPSPSNPPDRWWLPQSLQRKSIIHGWQPTDHVFLSVPVLGRTHTLQAHPFTIASAAPLQGPTHAWFNLLIRAQDGFTDELLRYAHTQTRVEVSLDGPYGSSHALDMLRASDCAILVAGGSGIAVTFPLVWALLTDASGRHVDDSEDKVVSARQESPAKQCVHMIWLTHSRSHRSWIPQEQLDEMVRLGLDLVVPEPTEEAGRPDIAGYVDGWVQGAAAEGRQVGVVASGPDGLNRVVRNVCAEAIGEGVGVRVAVEKFGW